jgi:hypothetical protein
LSTILCGTNAAAGAREVDALAGSGAALMLTVGTEGTGLVPLVPSSWQDKVAKKATATPEPFMLLGRIGSRD